MSDHPIVEAHDVVKIYDDGKVRALDGVDLVVQEAELVAITGPSGCGKSTLLHLLAALDVPTSGSITVHDHDLCHLHHADSFRRYEVGLIFQLHNLLPRLTVLENVEIAMVGSHRSRVQQRRRAHRQSRQHLGLDRARDLSYPARRARRDGPARDPRPGGGGGG